MRCGKEELLLSTDIKCSGSNFLYRSLNNRLKEISISNNYSDYADFLWIEILDCRILKAIVSTQENYPWIGTDKKIFLCLV